MANQKGSCSNCRHKECIRLPKEFPFNWLIRYHIPQMEVILVIFFLLEWKPFMCGTSSRSESVASGVTEVQILSCLPGYLTFFEVIDIKIYSIDITIKFQFSLIQIILDITFSMYYYFFHSLIFNCKQPYDVSYTVNFSSFSYIVNSVRDETMCSAPECLSQMCPLIRICWAGSGPSPTPPGLRTIPWTQDRPRVSTMAKRYWFEPWDQILGSMFDSFLRIMEDFKEPVERKLFYAWTLQRNTWGELNTGQIIFKDKSEKKADNHHT